MAAKIKALQQWCHRMTDGYPGVSVVNFTTSWRDGLAFCALIHRFRPDLIDFDSLSSENVFDNCKMAFEVAEQELKIPAFLEAEDMVRLKVPDKLSIITYVSQYYNHLHAKPQLGGPGVKGQLSNKAAGAKRHTDPDSSQAPISKKPSTVETKENSVPKSDEIKTAGDNCTICQKHVYLMERHIEGGKLYHRSCFRHSEMSPANKIYARSPFLSPSLNAESPINASSSSGVEGDRNAVFSREFGVQPHKNPPEGKFLPKKSVTGLKHALEEPSREDTKKSKIQPRTLFDVKSTLGSVTQEKSESQKVDISEIKISQPQKSLPLSSKEAKLLERRQEESRASEHSTSATPLSSKLNRPLIFHQDQVKESPKPLASSSASTAITSVVAPMVTTSASGHSSHPSLTSTKNTNTAQFSSSIIQTESRANKGSHVPTQYTLEHVVKNQETSDGIHIIQQKLSDKSHELSEMPRPVARTNIESAVPVGEVKLRENTSSSKYKLGTLPDRTADIPKPTPRKSLLLETSDRDPPPLPTSVPPQLPLAASREVYNKETAQKTKEENVLHDVKNSLNSVKLTQESKISSHAGFRDRQLQLDDSGKNNGQNLTKTKVVDNINDPKVSNHFGVKLQLTTVNSPLNASVHSTLKPEDQRLELKTTSHVDTEKTESVKTGLLSSLAQIRAAPSHSSGSGASSASIPSSKVLSSPATLLSSDGKITRDTPVLTTTTSNCRIGTSLTPASSSKVGNSLTTAPSSKVGNSLTTAPSSKVGNSLTTAPSSKVGNSLTTAPSSKIGNSVTPASSSKVSTSITPTLSRPLDSPAETRSVSVVQDGQGISSKVVPELVAPNKSVTHKHELAADKFKTPSKTTKAVSSSISEKSDPFKETLTVLKPSGGTPYSSSLNNTVELKLSRPLVASSGQHHLVNTTSNTAAPQSVHSQNINKKNELNQNLTSSSASFKTIKDTNSELESNKNQSSSKLIPGHQNAHFQIPKDLPTIKAKSSSQENLLDINSVQLKRVMPQTKDTQKEAKTAVYDVKLKKVDVIKGDKKWTSDTETPQSHPYGDDTSNLKEDQHSNRPHAMGTTSFAVPSQKKGVRDEQLQRKKETEPTGTHNKLLTDQTDNSAHQKTEKNVKNYALNSDNKVSAASRLNETGKTGGNLSLERDTAPVRKGSRELSPVRQRPENGKKLDWQLEAEKRMAAIANIDKEVSEKLNGVHKTSKVSSQETIIKQTKAETILLKTDIFKQSGDTIVSHSKKTISEDGSVLGKKVAPEYKDLDEKLAFSKNQLKVVGMERRISVEESVVRAHEKEEEVSDFRDVLHNLKRVATGDGDRTNQQLLGKELSLSAETKSNQVTMGRNDNNNNKGLSAVHLENSGVKDVRKNSLESKSAQPKDFDGAANKKNDSIFPTLLKNTHSSQMTNVKDARKNSLESKSAQPNDFVASAIRKIDSIVPPLLTNTHSSEKANHMVNKNADVAQDTSEKAVNIKTKNTGVVTNTVETGHKTNKKAGDTRSDTAAVARKKIIPIDQVEQDEVKPKPVSQTPKKKIEVTAKFDFEKSSDFENTLTEPTAKLTIHDKSPLSDQQMLPVQASQDHLSSPHISALELQQQLKFIDTRLTELELRGRDLEKTIRNVSVEVDDDDDELMIEWFSLVNEKNDLVRKEADLIYLSREQDLESEQEQIESQLRYLLSKSDDCKSPEERQEEDYLIQRKVNLVEQRNVIVDSMDEDRIRYEEEDKNIADVLKDKGYWKDSTGSMRALKGKKVSKSTFYT